MSHSDTSERSEPSVDTTRTGVGSDGGYASTVPSTLRQVVGSGAVAAIVGGVGLLGGLRALRRGERMRGLFRLVLAAAFLAVAVVQRRSSGSGRRSGPEEADVVGTGPDVESIADEAGGVGDADHAAGEAASAVADASPDVEEATSGHESGVEHDAEAQNGGASGSVDQRDVAGAGVDSRDLAEATAGEAAEAGGGDGESRSGGEAIGPEEVERLGEAAFDGQSHEVPAPQRAFNRGFLAHSSETFWGVRARDDAVLVSADYDALSGRDGVRYVASSAVGDDVRELPIPDTVLDHWDAVLGGGTAVAGGDGILFATTDDLAADGVLWVLPADWADDVLGETE